MSCFSYELNKAQVVERDRNVRSLRYGSSAVVAMQRQGARTARLHVGGVHAATVRAVRRRHAPAQHHRSARVQR